MKNDRNTIDLEEFDFAFSFAGEDREIVEKIYNELTEAGFRVFYDDAFQSQLVGKDLYSCLRNLYINKGKFVTCFISEHYSKKIWTNLEFTAIKERLMTTFFASDFLIPILIGEASRLEDIPSFIGFYRHKSIEETVEMLKEKINSSIVEDNFLLNINNYISYLCNRIYKRLLQQNVEVIQVNENILKITGTQDKFTLSFSPDPIAQTHCILIMKECYLDKGSSKDVFPTFIITWKREEELLFSIHEFDNFTNHKTYNIGINDVVTYICFYAKRCIGG